MNAVTPAMVMVQQADMGIPISEMVQTFRGANSDAGILSLRDEFRAAVAHMAEINRFSDVSDEDLDSAISRFDAACVAIVDGPPAQTRAGRALKAAAAKQQLRGEFCLEVDGDWPGKGHELVWHVLTELAGDEYFPSIGPNGEPPERSIASQGRVT